MQKTSFSRQYVILRPAQGSAGGFARLETKFGRGCITVQATQVTGQSLRAMLLSGDADSGAVIDLGLMTLTGRRQATLYREGLPAGYAACHTVAVCTDWPEPRLLLYGWLTASPACTLWQLQETVRHYLTVPARDTSVPEPEPAQEAEPSIQPAPAKAEQSVPPLRVLEARQVNASAHLLRLPRLEWPEELAELQCYFAELAPFAPFDAPGWRFVQVRLGKDAPAPWCAVGVRIRGKRVTGAAYALPGQPAALPPGGLQGYHWAEGRHGQGYWVTGDFGG